MTDDAHRDGGAVEFLVEIVHRETLQELINMPVVLLSCVVAHLLGEALDMTMLILTLDQLRSAPLLDRHDTDARPRLHIVKRHQGELGVLSDDLRKAPGRVSTNVHKVGNCRAVARGLLQVLGGCR